MKPRFTPALEKYEANTAKGLCAYCGRPLGSALNDFDNDNFLVEGIEHRIHLGCKKALLVAERLSGRKEHQKQSLTTAFIDYDRQFQAENDNEVIKNYFKRKAQQHQFQ